MSRKQMLSHDTLKKWGTRKDAPQQIRINDNWP